MASTLSPSRNRLGSAARCFTLIELLIVVAIIAILAAIAVVNFQEASTRSKVSRAKSDLRTMGVALEEFRIDHSDYPTRPLADKLILHGLTPLTTPLDYLSSIPEDVFAQNMLPNYNTGLPFDWTDAYRHPTTKVFLRPFPFDYLRRPAAADWSAISSHGESAIWAMRSAGPDNVPTWLGAGAPAYDPTNGSISAGDIYYTGPGIGLDQPISDP